ncbi:MAG: hypothetical protein OHK0038_28800 [Flammeovirgaceae bacterium]
MLFLATILFALFVVGLPLFLTWLSNARYNTDKDWQNLKQKFSTTKIPRENIHIIPKAKIGKKKLKYALKIAIDTDGVSFHVSKLFSSLAVWFVPWSYIDNLSTDEDKGSIHFSIENVPFELYPVDYRDFYKTWQENYDKRVL